MAKKPTISSYRDWDNRSIMARNATYKIEPMLDKLEKVWEELGGTSQEGGTEDPRGPDNPAL